jgi:hypothetical protein
MISIWENKYPRDKGLKHCWDELEQCAAESNVACKASRIVEVIVIPA